jgi:hypothetical protein
MKPLFYLLLMGFTAFGASAQPDQNLRDHIEDRNAVLKRNALPPGPTTISGCLVNQKGEPIKGAEITVRYPDGKQRDVDTFRSSDDGTFLVYVFRSDAPYVNLEIKSSKKVLMAIRYDQPGLGQNIGHPSTLIVVGRKQKQ